ncbi:hypothetical protein SBA1_550031 [Candidatus Sulfotelmatobacter kueseliae]|uniref:Uncharacterized protein n=1 Tax=Candidatus Sulfotelmatobacter kueseliae TaxID=2042962 RepID=A0A2U3KYA1_9BACT|nr:hypothetical protein SBA1_550031 [Candidatus Sulfotelmatobacter kueseliae]
MLIGFCRTKFAPMPKASWVVVFLPFRMANVTEFLLLGVLLRPCNTSSPPFRSSQSTMTASNFSEIRMSAADRASWQISTSIESFSSVGRITRTNSGSWLRRSDSNVMLVILGARDTGSKVTKVMRPLIVPRAFAARHACGVSNPLTRNPGGAKEELRHMVAALCPPSTAEYN